MPRAGHDDAPPTPDDVQARIAQLREEHAALERRLLELDSRRWLSTDEQLQRKHVKKLKLQKKDEISALERSANEA